MKKKEFIIAYFSVFGFLMSFQLQWAKQREIYTDIFSRFFVVLICTAPSIYILLQLIHFIKSKSGKQNHEVKDSLPILYSLSLFHLQWLQFVSDHKWPYSSLAILSLFFISVVIMVIRSVQANSIFSKSNNAGDALSMKESFKQVNFYFKNVSKQILKTVSYALSNPVKFTCLTFYPETWILLVMQLIIIIKFSVFSTPDPFLFPLNIVATFLFPVLLIQSVRILTFRIPTTGTLLTFIIALAYYLLTFYYVTENSPFDYSVVLLNSDLLAHNQSLILLFEKLQLQSYLLTFFCISYVVIICYLKPRKLNNLKSSSIRTGVLSGFVYAVLFLIPINNMDQLRGLYQSISEYNNQKRVIKAAAEVLNKPFPYEHFSGIPSDTTQLKPKPNIFLICLESYNGTLIEQKNEHGKYITPFFNSLIPHGVYLDHFYGNSVQTARGFFTLLTGTPPSFREKVATSMPELKFRGLPAILSDNGYSTCFMKAYHDLSYDNTGNFMSTAGFQTVLSMTEDMLSEKEKSMRWGWGLQDDYFYRKCFRILDSLHTKQVKDNNERPFFVTTFNVSNHMMFQDIPDSQKCLYPDAGQQDYYKNYRNSMFLTDSCLQEVFKQINQREWLQNSIIIIVGDHGFPSGIHSQKNEKGAWEENFKTPFLLIWKNHLKPSRLSQHAYSQIDLMPTLFDLIEITPANHSIGKSIFAPGPRDPVPLSQPYDGIYLASIEYPFKFVRRLRGNTLALFNLETDPMERRNLIQEQFLQPKVARLQESVTSIMINQQLLEENRIWSGKIGK